MSEQYLMVILKRALLHGDCDELEMQLDERCSYISYDAQLAFHTSKKILAHFSEINANRVGLLLYSCDIVALKSVATEQGLVALKNEGVCEYVILLYKNHKPNPLFIVYAAVGESGKITSITISKNRKLFDIDFDTPYTASDLPSTIVTSRATEHWWQEHDDKEIKKDGFYIWRKADEYMVDWLREHNFAVLGFTALHDCMRYHCRSGGKEYAVYLYAYNKHDSIQLNGEYCAEYYDAHTPRKITVLVACLRICREIRHGEIEYYTKNYYRNRDDEIVLWQLTRVRGETFFRYLPHDFTRGMLHKLHYAFNHESMDVYSCIMQQGFMVKDAEGKLYYKSAAYAFLHELHQKYGDAKIGYVSFNGVVYSKTLQLENYGCVSFTVHLDSRRIGLVEVSTFNGENSPLKDFIPTDEAQNDSLYDYVPRAIAAEPLEKAETERFALKVNFDNGECKKYVLDIKRKRENDESVLYRGYTFSDEIWRSARITEKSTDVTKEDPVRGAAVTFDNGFCIPTMLCYEDGAPYSEPQLCGDTVYHDDKISIKRLWKWNVQDMYEDEGNGLFKALIWGDRLTFNGAVTYATADGKRVSGLEFEAVQNYEDGLAKALLPKHGIGFIDKDIHFVIPPRYDCAEDFRRGKVKMKRDGRWYYVDREGKEKKAKQIDFESNYQDVGYYSEGRCVVSQLKLSREDLAYHSDFVDIAGICGFVNEDGKEIIAPQYIYANDFSNGIAIVCKGKWTIDKKWDSEDVKGKYWTEEERWGAIDRKGNEVVPFIFDAIHEMRSAEETFRVHIGGWDNGHWGVIDNKGKWLAEPLFGYIGDEYKDGLFAFSFEDRKASSDVKLGVYDTGAQKVLFEEQFKRVFFADDGFLEVTVYDEELGRDITKLIDKDGKEKFHSVYSLIYTCEEPCRVVIMDGGKEKSGLIDKNGNVLLPCEYEFNIEEFCGEDRLVIFEKEDKQGLMDFDGNVILEPRYLDIMGMKNPLLSIYVGKRGNYKVGLVTKEGKEILPAVYRGINWCSNNKFICSSDEGCEVMELL